MFKNILLSGLLCTYLSAESFDTFLQKAIVNSPYLKSSALEVDQSKEQGSLLTRYKNPSLELEYTDFNPNTGKNNDGYRVNISQPVRLWGVSDSIETLANTNIEKANASYAHKKSIFVRDISLSYISYTNRLSMSNLVSEELRIAKTIYDISASRYEAGTISRGLMLQAQIDYEMIQIKSETLALESSQAYYALLTLAGINEEIDFDNVYTFTTDRDLKSTNNSSLLVLKTKQNIALSQANLNINKVQWMEVFAEFESESEQDITRVGISIPLAVFNTKSQELSIAKLENKRLGLLIDNEEKTISITHTRLNKERLSYKNLYTKNEAILGSQEELLKMFQNGYKIANINLLQLQDIKNRVISTKRALIQIKTALDKNAVLLNYNQGKYND